MFCIVLRLISHYILCSCMRSKFQNCLVALEEWRLRLRCFTCQFNGVQMAAFQSRGMCTSGGVFAGAVWLVDGVLHYCEVEVH